MSIYSQSVSLVRTRGEMRTYEDEMEVPSLPLLDGLLSILGDGVLDSLLLHEHGQDSLVDGVICGARALGSGMKRDEFNSPSTMRTLIGGTVGSVALRVVLRLARVMVPLPETRRP